MTHGTATGLRPLRRSGAAARALSAVLALAAVLAVAGCGTAGANARTANADASGDGVLKIGVILDNTGGQDFLNESELAAVKLAVQQANDAGGLKGKPVELLPAQTGEDSAAQAKALAAQHVDAVIGPTDSSHAPAAIDILSRSQSVLISPANTAAGLSTYRSGGYYFRTAASETAQATALVNLAKDSGRRTVAVLHEEGPYGQQVGQAVREAIAAAGLTAGADIEVKAGAAQAAAGQAAGADAVVVVARDGAAALLSALNGAGVQGEKILLSDGAVAPYGPALAQGALSAARGVLPGRFPSPAFTARLLAVDPKLKDLSFAAESFDATLLAILAADAADDDGGASIAANLIAVSGGGSPDGQPVKCSNFIACTGALKQGKAIDYEGESGTVNFDRNGDITVANYEVYSYGDDNKPKLTGTQTAVRAGS